MIKLSQLNCAENSQMPGLIRLLQDAVGNGASVGFLRPLSDSDAQAYWAGVFSEVNQRAKIVLIAKIEEQIVGSVQLSLCTRQNGRHRAEVQKLFVHTSFRRRGIARQLMSAIESTARNLNRSLLYLDTEPDQPAEKMYRELGWTEAGKIPNFACSPDGHLHGTAIFFKELV